jgi:hypothetical protein
MRRLYTKNDIQEVIQTTKLPANVKALKLGGDVI